MINVRGPNVMANGSIHKAADGPTAKNCRKRNSCDSPNSGAHRKGCGWAMMRREAPSVFSKAGL